MAGQLPDKSLAFQKQLQQAHSPDLELEKMEVPNGEKNEKSEKSKSYSYIFIFNIYYILVDKSLKVLKSEKSEKSENSIPILFFGVDIFF